MQDSEILMDEIHEEKTKAQIANIKEELDMFMHDLPALNTVYLILRRMRTGANVEAEAGA